MIRIFHLILFLGLLALPAAADKMTVETHGLVIEKLESARGRMDPGGISYVRVTKRLADLYAERARLISLREVEKNCNACLGSTDDRKKALGYYEYVLAKDDSINPGAIIMQMAHLYDYLGQTTKAIALHNKIISSGKSKYSSQLINSSHMALGIIYYHRGNFKKSERHLKKAEKNAPTKKQGFIKYHLAWCYLNLGQPVRARRLMTAILKNPEYLIRDSDGNVVDRSFQQQAAKDLATFYARSRVGQKEIQELFDLSPEGTRLANLKYLATEVERLGGKKSALSIWSVYVANETNHQEHVEAYIRMAQLDIDAGWKKSALRDLRKAAALWPKMSCKDQNRCDELRKRFRNLIASWNNIEKNQPTTQLADAYDVYLTTFPSDGEMHGFAAKVASQTKRHALAFKHFRKAATLAAEMLDNNNSTSHRQKLEGSLLGEIEAAETLKSYDKRNKAYDHYLSLNPKGSKTDEVRYQKAHIQYEKKDHRKAAEAFYSLVMDKNFRDRKLKKKAADLSLDSLALLKDHQSLEQWAISYAAALPAHRTEYLTLSRKAVHHQVAQVAHSKSSDQRDYQRALKKLQTTSLKGASYTERMDHYKDMISLAKKTEDVDSALVATNAILYAKGLRKTDKEFGMAQRVWLAEVQLDFKTAYKLSKNMKMSGLSAEKRHMRLAVLAELAGYNPDQHYKAFIKATPSLRRANEIRARLVLKAKYPWSKLEDYKSKLKRTPDILANTTLEIFAKHRNYTRARKILKIRSVARQPAGRLLSRQVFYLEYDKVARNIRRHKIRTSSNYLLGRTMKRRLDLLGQTEGLVKQAARSKDWVLELLTLSLVQEQNERLHKEILALPAPRNLKKKQRVQYKKLLAQQAAPYKKEAKRIQWKLGQLWKHKNSFQRVIDNHKLAAPEVRNVTGSELLQLVSVAPSFRKSELQRALDHRLDLPSRKEIMAARKRLRDDPFDLGKAKSLRDLESRAGSVVMVAFLDARATAIRKGVRQ